MTLKNYFEKILHSDSQAEIVELSEEAQKIYFSGEIPIYRALGLQNSLTAIHYFASRPASEFDGQPIINNATVAINLLNEVEKNEL